MEKLVISHLTSEDIRHVVREEINHVLNNFYPAQDVAERLLSRSEAAELLGISLPTLGTWTIQGRLQGYRMGSRVYYKYSEILDSLKEISTKPA